jgi:glycosyltransferase involved in cell wall biosynthesis/SAM-dependent methyltransferase
VRILMIAPEPFFEPRGTPFSEFHRIRALTDLGHQVDLVTYPFGRDVTMAGLRIFRSARPPFVRAVGIGPSLRKLPLDLLLAIAVLRRMLSTRYDAVHSHEEGGVIGVAVAALWRIPHVYDMHSSLPQQLENFAFSRSRVLRRLFLAIERVMIQGSAVVIVVCPSLEDTARRVDASARPILIENAPGSLETATPDEARARRRESGVPATAPLIVYTGTFEPYQGLDLLFDAMTRVHKVLPEARLLLVGGKAEQVEKAREQVRATGIDSRTLFVGERPAEEIPSYLLASNALVSPRSQGTNTPLKIYQYLRSGKPLVATRLLTHTQVLDDDVAILTAPTGEAFAAGILRALENQEEASAIAERARRLSETKYSYDAYLQRTGLVCSALGQEVGAARTHYSYAHYDDPDTARSFEPRRFGGPIGEIVATDQAAVLAHFVGSVAGRSVLDVGTGTGRAAFQMARAGARVTAVDASEPMLAVARKRASEQQLSVCFERGDVHHLAFPDRSFDIVVSLRVLMHAIDWRRSISELCRVANHLVVVDFPSSTSAAALESLSRRAIDALGARTEPYRVLSERVVAAQLASLGFRIRATHRQFALPIAVHKMIGSPQFTAASESLFDRVNVTQIIGTPVTIVAERCKS